MWRSGGGWVIFSYTSIETDLFLQPVESPSAGDSREYRLFRHDVRFYIQSMPQIPYLVQIVLLTFSPCILFLSTYIYTHIHTYIYLGHRDKGPGQILGGKMLAT